MIKKLLYIIKFRYNPYLFYWFDLLTERHLKYRTGECIDCVDCCEHCCDSTIVGNCYCKYVDLINKRCKIYEKRICNIWFPISQKELDYMKSIKLNLNCKYKFREQL